MIADDWKEVYDMNREVTSEKSEADYERNKNCGGKLRKLLLQRGVVLLCGRRLCKERGTLLRA